jgi:hypothetical protein
MSAGTLSQISFAKETTWGTAVTPDKSIAVRPTGGIRTETAGSTGMLDSQEEDIEGKEALEQEIAKFEKWVDKVRPSFIDPDYKPSYAEKRLAVRIIGVHCSVYPTKGNHPRRYEVTFTVPDVLEKAKRIVLPSTAG